MLNKLTAHQAAYTFSLIAQWNAITFTNKQFELDVVLERPVLVLGIAARILYVLAFFSFILQLLTN